MDLAKIPLIILAIVSILGSAFASFSELSLFIVDRVRLHRIISKEKRKSRYLKKLLEYHRETLITILFMNLLFNTLFTIVVSDMLVSLNIILSTIVISGVITIFGEVLPKVGGYTIAERMVILISRIVFLINFLGKPFFKFIDTVIISRFVKRGYSISRKDRANFFEILKRNTRNPRLKNFIEVLDLDVKDMMKPISDVVLISSKEKNILESHFPIPKYILIYEGARTNIIGAVSKYNLTKVVIGEHSIMDYIEPVNFVPETKKIYDLITELKYKNINVSVVIDEYGNVIGVFTFDEMFDYVFKIIPQGIKKISKNSYLVDGDTSLNEFNKFFELELNSQFYNTISGFVIESLGKIPSKGEEIKLSNITIKVNDVSSGKIENIIVELS